MPLLYLNLYVDVNDDICDRVACINLTAKTIETLLLWTGQAAAIERTLRQATPQGLSTLRQGLILAPSRRLVQFAERDALERCLTEDGRDKLDEQGYMLVHRAISHVDWTKEVYAQVYADAFTLWVFASRWYRSQTVEDTVLQRLSLRGSQRKGA